MNTIQNIEYTIRNVTFIIPEYLKELIKAIEKSAYILDLKYDFDDNKSLSYNIKTWEKSINFIINFGKYVFENYRQIILIPKIYHGKNGGIDLLWENYNSDCKIFIRLDEYVMKGVFVAYNIDQESKGNFLVSNVDFSLLPIPISKTLTN